MRLISWNLNGRASALADQVAAVVARGPDIVALQEVTTRSAPVLASALALKGLPHAINSFALAPPGFIAAGPRRYGLLIASRFPLDPLPLGTFDLPWPERVLSVRVLTPGGPTELYTTHIPPGSSNGWIKVEMLTGLYKGLARLSAVPRILCGDFNLPQAECTNAEIVTWAQRIRPNGQIVCRARVRGGPGPSWDAAERNVIIGLAAYDLLDVFRALHGNKTQAFSWVLRRGRKSVPRRFDHIFASARLRPTSCLYIHAVRQRGLSDHAAIEVVFQPTVEIVQNQSVAARSDS